MTRKFLLQRLPREEELRRHVSRYEVFEVESTCLGTPDANPPLPHSTRTLGGEYVPLLTKRARALPSPEEAAGIQCLLPTPDMGGAPLRARRGVNSVSSHVEL